MRLERLLCLLPFLAVASLVWVVNLAAQPEDIVLDDYSVFYNRSRPPVPFPHMLHIDSEIECSQCHHRFKGGENVVDEAELEEDAAGIKCAECHKNNPGFRLEPDLDPTNRNLRQAYHRMCTGCHRQLQKENKKTGAVTCGGCHPKK
jgi:c(7)-type cytochrome triheme protein